jgi:hypothetical protein
MNDTLHCFVWRLNNWKCTKTIVLINPTHSLWLKDSKKQIRSFQPFWKCVIQIFSVVDWTYSVFSSNQFNDSANIHYFSKYEKRITQHAPTTSSVNSHLQHTYTLSLVHVFLLCLSLVHIY